MPFRPPPYRATMKTVQSPLQSGFGVSSTASQVIDGINLTGKVAMVTGGRLRHRPRDGQGAVRAGASVVVPARNLPRARQTLNGLQGVEVELMDLMEPASIATFAAHFEASGRPLHIIVASAGIGGAPLFVTPEVTIQFHNESPRSLRPGLPITSGLPSG